MESAEHIRLVRTLAAAMRHSWVASLVTEDLPRVRRCRHWVGHHVPDVVAWTPKNGEVQAIGEAKPHHDLWSGRFRDQLQDWTAQEGLTVCLVTSEGSAGELQTVVEATIGNQAHARVRILDGPFWWSRREGSINDWIWR